jgi:hypothetical protein
MVALRQGTACLAVTLALVSLGSAGLTGQEGPKPGAKAGVPVTKGGILLPPAIEAELRLDDVQRAKVRMLEAEFKQRRQGGVMMTGLRMKALFDRLDDGNAREAMPVLTIANEVTGVLMKMRQARLDYEKKVMAVLNDEQRAKYAAWLERSPREKRLERKAKRIDRGEARPLPDLDRELQLTPEQHRKLAEMDREWEQRFRKLLTEEQRRRYDELLRNAPRPGAPGDEQGPAAK